MTRSRFRNTRSVLASWIVACLIGGVCIPVTAQEDVEVEVPAEAEVEADVEVEVPVPEESPDSYLGVGVGGEPKRLRDHGLPGLEKKVNLNALVPWQLVDLIEFLAVRGGLNNIVIAKGVEGLATKLKFEDITVGDALEVVLSVNKLSYEVKGGIITVMTDEEYQNLYGTSFYDSKKAKIVELIYADASRVASILEPIKSTIGTVVFDQVTGTLILIDTPDKIREMEAVIETADISTISRVLPTETKTFVLQYAQMEEIQPQVEAALTKEAGALRSDSRTRTLIVTDLPHNMEKVEQLIGLFDKAPRQVFIEAKIVETTLSDQYSLGINWQHVFQGLDPRFSLDTVVKPGLPFAPSPSLFRSSSSELATGGTLSYNTIVAGGELSAVLAALATIGETKILQNPHIAVLDGQEASIEVIEDQPYKEVTIESGTTNVTGVTYLFKKVGVLLSVTPRINDEEMISVAIKPEISSISEWYDGGVQEGTPVIKKSLAETMVMVKDGVTVIIGGLIRNEKVTSTSKVPLLGSVPLFGRLFRQDSDSDVSKETVVFLTPRIITGDESYLRMKDVKKKPKPLRSVGRVPPKQLRSVR